MTVVWNLHKPVAQDISQCLKFSLRGYWVTKISSVHMPSYRGFFLLLLWPNFRVQESKFFFNVLSSSFTAYSCKVKMCRCQGNSHKLNKLLTSESFIVIHVVPIRRSCGKMLFYWMQRKKHNSQGDQIAIARLVQFLLEAKSGQMVDQIQWEEIKFRL